MPRADANYPGFRGQNLQWYPENIVTTNPFGDTFYVDYGNGSDTANSGAAVNDAYKTLGRAHTAATSGKGDTIYVNGATNIQEESMLTWSKNRITVISTGTAGVVDPRPEIQLSSTANGESNAATVKVTGYGNTFNGLTFWNAGTHSDSLSALWDAGENNVYNNCQIAKASDLDETAVANAIGAGDTTTWRNCKFGVTWVTVSVARAGLLISGTSGTSRMKHNFFENCLWTVNTTEANYDHIRVKNTDAIAFENTFINPVFNTSINNSSGGVITTVAVDGGTGTAEASLLFVNPSCNTTNFATATTGIKVVGNGMLAHNAGAAVSPTAHLGIGIVPA